MNRNWKIAIIVIVFFGINFLISLFWTTPSFSIGFLESFKSVTWIRKLNPLEINLNSVLNVSSSVEFVSKIKIFCWVLTQPSNHATKAKAVKETWGRRCDKLLFISSSKDDSLPAIDFGIEESRSSLWAKTRAAFKYIHANYVNDFQWFLKADDDTFIIVENLRYLLSSYDTNEDRVYFGELYKHRSTQTRGFVAGGAGYVLSRTTLKQFVEVAMRNSTLCNPTDTWSEDVQMSQCLENIGIWSEDSRDANQRGRFFALDPEKYLAPGAIPDHSFYRKYIYYPIEVGSKCCSDLAISFHYIPPKRMYELEYLIYRLHPFGITYNDSLPTRLYPDKKKIREEIQNRILKEFEKRESFHPSWLP